MTTVRRNLDQPHTVSAYCTHCGHGADLDLKALLEVDADEAELIALDTEKRRLERQIAKLELTERRLLEAAREIQGRNREAEWSGLKTAYSEKASAFIAAQREAMRGLAEVEEVCRSAERLGFALQGMSVLPIPPHVFDANLIVGYEAAVRDLAKRPPPAPAAPMRNAPCALHAPGIATWQATLRASMRTAPRS